MRILGGFLVVWFGALFVVFNKSHTLICFLLHRSQCSSSNVFFSSKVPTYRILTGTCTETNRLRRIPIIIKKKDKFLLRPKYLHPDILISFSNVFCFQVNLNRGQRYEFQGIYHELKEGFEQQWICHFATVSSCKKQTE